MSDTAHAEEHHPSTKKYIQIFILLTVLTAVEVGIVFIHLPKLVLIIALCVLALWKAALVAAHFMHLKYDPRRMSLPAIVPLILLVFFVFIMSYEALRGNHIHDTVGYDQPAPAAGEHP